MLQSTRTLTQSITKPWDKTIRWTQLKGAIVRSRDSLELSSVGLKTHLVEGTRDLPRAVRKFD